MRLASIPSLFSAVLGLVGISPAWAGPQFVQLASDQTSYTVGAKAILDAVVSIVPSNPDDEVYLSAQFSGSPINVIPVSETQVYSVTQPFVAAGTYQWIVTAYFQDKKAATAFNKTIAYYSKEIVTKKNAQSWETDPVKLSELQAIVSRDQAIVSLAHAQLTAIRRQVEVDVLSVVVTSARQNKAMSSGASGSPAFVVTLDRPFPSYHPAEMATFTIQVLTDFFGTDGPRENVVTATIDSQPVGVTQADDRDFASVTAAFVAANAGNHAYVASLYTRSKAQSDSLRDGVSKATARQTALVAQKAAATDPAIIAYLQTQITELSEAIQAFYTQLNAILLFVGTQEQDYQVLSTKEGI